MSASRIVAAAVIAALAVAACNTPIAGSPTPASGSQFDTAAARSYCTAEGGKLVDRSAVWNTNGDPSTWLYLAGRQTFCEFEMGTGDTTTRISVDLVTLYSEQPTLAGVAYLTKVPPTLPDTPSVNPAAYNCTVGLGGASYFGSGPSAGGWVNVDEPVFKIMNECFFADGSAIDEFGILYYATGTVRGADLATKMRYQPGDKLPAIWPR